MWPVAVRSVLPCLGTRAAKAVYVWNCLSTSHTTRPRLLAVHPAPRATPIIVHCTRCTTRTHASQAHALHAGPCSTPPHLHTGTRTRALRSASPGPRRRRQAHTPFTPPPSLPPPLPLPQERVQGPRGVRCLGKGGAGRRRRRQLDGRRHRLLQARVLPPLHARRCRAACAPCCAHARPEGRVLCAPPPQTLLAHMRTHRHAPSSHPGTLRCATCSKITSASCWAAPTA